MFFTAPWTGDQPIARPVPSQENETQINMGMYPWLEQDSNARPHCYAPQLLRMCRTCNCWLSHCHTLTAAARNAPFVSYAVAVSPWFKESVQLRQEATLAVV